MQPPASDVSSLQGLTAYFGCARAFKQALAGLPHLAHALFLDGVGVLIQAETFLFAERGYPSLDAYVHHWQEFYRGSCRYYSNLDAVSRSWSDHMNSRRPGSNLFNRFKTLALDRAADGLWLRGCMSDSFHELAFTLQLEPGSGKVLLASGDIIRAPEGDIIRAPDRVCGEAARYLRGLKGAVLRNAGRREIAALLGHGQGCVHLIDLVADAAALLAQAGEGTAAEQFSDGGDDHDPVRKHTR